MGTVVVPGAIYGVIVVCFMFPNAELALMFIPVPIRQNISGLVLVDLYLGVQDNLFLEAVSHILLTLRCFIWLSNYVVLEEESV
jgi:hypothetical protein